MDKILQQVGLFKHWNYHGQSTHPTFSIRSKGLIDKTLFRRITANSINNLLKPLFHRRVARFGRLGRLI